MPKSSLPSMRLAWLLGFLACAGLIAYVLYLEYFQGIEPCPLCILQRVAFIGLGVVFLIGGLHAPRGGGRWVYAIVLLLIGLIGIAVASRHVWLQSLPPSEVPACGPSLGYMMGTFPLSEVLKMVLTGSGECAQVSWRFLGLAMPVWSLLCLIALTLWGLVNTRRPSTPRIFLK